MLKWWVKKQTKKKVCGVVVAASAATAAFSKKSCQLGCFYFLAFNQRRPVASTDCCSRSVLQIRAIFELHSAVFLCPTAAFRCMCLPGTPTALHRTAPHCPLCTELWWAARRLVWNCKSCFNRRLMLFGINAEVAKKKKKKVCLHEPCHPVGAYVSHVSLWKQCRYKMWERWNSTRIGLVCALIYKNRTTPVI